MTLVVHLKEQHLLMLFVLFSFICSPQLKGEDTYNYFYRITFRDKGNNHPENFIPGQLLSERAIQRRKDAGISFPDYKDIPVSGAYLDQVKNLGLTLHCTSKWMNSAVFKSKVQVNAESLMALSSVSDVRLVKTPSAKGSSVNKLDFESSDFQITGYDKPVRMLNGSLLHSVGYDGKGILIAVLDAGFTNADKLSSLVGLKSRSGIRGTYDFVLRSNYVYGYHTHGTAVISTLAGRITNYIEGSAPGADYLLLRTEDGNSEFPVEEDFWVAGAEFADSAGADIISSSLGYAMFDNPSMNYKFSDLDGNTAFVTRAADIAASKGMIVVASAGNERNKDWKRILAPADGDSVLAVAAVDSLKNIASFSSAGPAADVRIKPDLAAMGVNVIVQVTPDKLSRASGTSFSCPLLSGMIACLWQAQRNASPSGIINALIRSADRFNTPDSLYGYGVPDAIKTLNVLQGIYLVKPEKGSLSWPNPTSGVFEVTLKEIPLFVKAEIFSSAGNLISSKTIAEFAGRTIYFDELVNSDNGIYFIRISTDKYTFVEKVIKIRN